MACGTPVIGSNVGGIKYSVVDERTGFLVPPHEPDVLANRIIQLLNDNALHQTMCKNAIKHVQNNFTWSKVATQIQRVYNKVFADVQKPAKQPVKQLITDHAALLNMVNILPAFKRSVI
jgi:glycosyltransferase involved in cell wall biosynthesis